MEFLNPAALYTFSLLPLLLLPYLIRRKPRRFVFSSLLLLKDFSAQSSNRPWGRLRLPLIFFLQLLLLSLLILALGEPVYRVRAPEHLAIVLDNSASMEALEGRESRFQMVKERARELIHSLSGRVGIDLFLTVPRFGRLGANLAPGKALASIDRLRPYDLGDSRTDHGKLLHRLGKKGGYDRIYFLTDHPAQGRGGAIEVISVGHARENFAITSFQLSPASFASSRLRANVELTSFSSGEKKVKLLLKGGGRVLFSRTVRVPPRRSVAVSFEDVPLRRHYKAEIGVDDALPLDNQRFAVPPAAREMPILAVSPRPRTLLSLRSIPGVRLKVVSPEAYSENAGSGQSLEIFHYSVPSVLPKNPALFVLPPRNNPLVSVGEPLAGPVISGWLDPHPLTRYVNFALFRPAYARPLRPVTFGESIIQSPQGPLAVALRHQGVRYLVLGFDPFPYLGRKNLPLSIFTLNLLNWFYGGLGRSDIPTGAPLEIQGRSRAGVVITPHEEAFQIREGEKIFSRTFFQGIYQVVRKGGKQFKAANLHDVRESDLAHPAPVHLEEVVGSADSDSYALSLWPYFLLLAFLLLFLEWLANPPVREPNVPAVLTPERGGV